MPAVSAESTFITLTIAATANEKSKVKCHDIPRVFVNTDLDKDVLMVLKGELAEIFTDCSTNLQKIRDRG